MNFNFLHTKEKAAYKQLADSQFSDGEAREIREMVSFYVILCLAVLSGLFIWSLP